MEQRSALHKGVLLKGLPFSATKNDIKQFFRNIDIPNEHITIILFRDHKHTGLGFVQLTSDEVQRALLNDRNHMGDRYVEVIASDEVELYDLVLMAREGEMDAREINRIAGRGARRGGVRDRSPIRRQISTKCAYINGVPPGFTYKSVREFFKGCLIAHNCIYLLKLEGSGTFRGDGYVEFGSKEECLKGLRKNGEMMGDSFIQVVPCSEEEMMDATQMLDGHQGRDLLSGHQGRDLRATIRTRQAYRDQGRGRTPSPVRRRMKAYAATYRRQEHEGYGDDYSEPLAGLEEPLLHPHHADYTRPSRLAEFEEQRQHWASERHSHDMRYREPPRKEPVHMPPRKEPMHMPPRKEPMPMYHEHLDRRPPQYLGHEQLPPRPEYDRHYNHNDKYDHGHQTHQTHHKYPPMNMPEDVGGHPIGPPSHQEPPAKGQERRMVRLEGLPYETSVRHILEFFQGYPLEFEHVRIQCREDGSPSGKAFVVFPSEKHARAAVHSHDKQYILGRYVEVVLV